MSRVRRPLHWAIEYHTYSFLYFLLTGCHFYHWSTEVFNFSRNLFPFVLGMFPPKMNSRKNVPAINGVNTTQWKLSQNVFREIGYIFTFLR
jgi:hypothetical protein